MLIVLQVMVMEEAAGIRQDQDNVPGKKYLISILFL